MVSSWPDSLHKLRDFNCFDTWFLLDKSFRCRWVSFLPNNLLFLDPSSKSGTFFLPSNASDVSLGSSGTDKCIAVTLVSLYIQPFRFFKVTSSPSLDLDQSCQAGEQAKLNSIGGVFLGSSSILHTSVLLGHSFPSTFKPSDSSRLTPLLLQF